MKRMHFFSGMIIAGLVAFLLIGCQDQSTNPYNSNPNAPPPVKTPNTVSMANMTYSPGSLTIAKGTTVTWQNNDNVLHTATSDSGSWDTGYVPAGSNKAITFNTAGTYTYHCFFHGSMGMVGTIIVK